MKNKAIKKLVYAAYLSGGFSVACDTANKIQGICYEYCEACDADAPTIKNGHECLICGQSTVL